MRGTKYRILLSVTGATIVFFVFYAVFCFTDLTGKRFRFWYFMAVCIFIVVHWVLAYTYFACATELPYVMKRKEPPEKLKKTNQVLFWTITVIGIVSSTWTLS